MLKCLNCRNLFADSDLIQFDGVDGFSLFDGQVLLDNWCICSICKEMIRLNLLVKYPKVIEKPEYLQTLLFNAVRDLYRRKVINKEYDKIRNEISKYLPSTLSQKEIDELRQNAVCPLSGDTEDLTMDHFIPVNWGHGGVYLGNIYFICRRLNGSKSNQNPFRWFRRISRNEEVNKKSWDNVVIQFAKEYGLNKKEFKDFVLWCENNQRSIEQLKIDNRPSIELWKESQ